MRYNIKNSASIWDYKYIARRLHNLKRILRIFGVIIFLHNYKLYSRFYRAQTIHEQNVCSILKHALNQNYRIPKMHCGQWTIISLIIFNIIKSRIFRIILIKLRVELFMVSLQILRSNITLFISKKNSQNTKAYKSILSTYKQYNNSRLPIQDI